MKLRLTLGALLTPVLLILAASLLAADFTGEVVDITEDDSIKIP